MTDDRMSLGLITDILDVLDRHGFARGDNEHAGRAILLVSDLVRIYEGSQDEPVGPYIGETPSWSAPPEPPGPGSQTAITVPPGELKTVLAALDIAADYKRGRAEMCADCSDQSCPTCLTRLHDAQAYDQMADRMLQAAEAALGIHHGHTEPPGPPRQASLAADKGGWPVTTPGRTPGEPAPRLQADRPLVPAPRSGDKDMREIEDPYDLPFPDRWPDRPKYVIGD